MDEVDIKSAAVDIFCYIVEFSPVTVREFMVREARQQDDVSGSGKIWLPFFVLCRPKSVTLSIVSLASL